MNIVLKLKPGLSYFGEGINIPSSLGELEVDITSPKIHTQTLKQIAWLGNTRHVFDMSVEDLHKIEKELCNRD